MLEAARIVVVDVNARTGKPVTGPRSAVLFRAVAHGHLDDGCADLLFLFPLFLFRLFFFLSTTTTLVPPEPRLGQRQGEFGTRRPALALVLHHDRRQPPSGVLSERHRLAGGKASEVLPELRPARLLPEPLAADAGASAAGRWQPDQQRRRVFVGVNLTIFDGVLLLAVCRHSADDLGVARPRGREGAGQVVLLGDEVARPLGDAACIVPRVMGPCPR